MKNTREGCLNLTLIEELTGTSWSLQTYQSQDVNGEVFYPLGEDAEGIISITDKAWFVVEIMANDKNYVLTQKMLNKFNTAIEREMAEYGFHAYSGPIEIDEEESILTTHVKYSLIRDYVGTSQRRKLKLEDDKLHLYNVEYPERRLVWKRL